MLITRMTPKASENPLARMNSNDQNAMPLTRSPITYSALGSMKRTPFSGVVGVSAVTTDTPTLGIPRYIETYGNSREKAGCAKNSSGVSVQNWVVVPKSWMISLVSGAVTSNTYAGTMTL